MVVTLFCYWCSQKVQTFPYCFCLSLFRFMVPLHHFELINEVTCELSLVSPFRNKLARFARRCSFQGILGHFNSSAPGWEWLPLSCTCPNLTHTLKVLNVQLLEYPNGHILFAAFYDNHPLETTMSPL